MSFLNGLVDKFKKEVVDKVVDAIKEENAAAAKPAEAPEAKPAEEPKPAVKPTTTVIPGHTGFVIGGGSVPQPAGPDRDWYQQIPEEECQYNFDGTYLNYFARIFREEFPGYIAAFETIDPGRRFKYTFKKDGADKLVVELMTEKSEANKLRSDCRKAGMPYVRFYFDHKGWWNTREYVVSRVSEALGL